MTPGQGQTHLKETEYGDSGAEPVLREVPRKIESQDVKILNRNLVDHVTTGDLITNDSLTCLSGVLGTESARATTRKVIE